VRLDLDGCLKRSQLLPQMVHVHGNRIGLRQRISTVDIVKKHILRHQSPLPSHQLFQNRHFVAREIQRSISYGDIAGHGIEGDVAGGQDRPQYLARPTQERADASHQFFHGKRFDQIIIGAGVEPPDAIFDAVARGQDQNGQPTAGAADGLDQS
jgi:hypothetical protein